MSVLTVEEQFGNALAADANIGPLVGTRVYVAPLPQNSLQPAITIQRITTIRNWVRARGGQFADMGFTRLQLDIWDDTDNASYQRVSQIMQYIMQVLRTFDAYQGATPSRGSNRILTSRIEPIPETQPPGYRGMMDVKIWFSDNT